MTKWMTYGIVLLALPVYGQCIFEAKDGPYDPGTIVAALYTNIPYFSADATITIDHHDGRSMPPVYVHYSAIRGSLKCETDLTRSAPDPAPLIESGRTSVHTIHSVHTNALIVQYPDRKGYYLDRISEADRFVPTYSRNLFLDGVEHAGRKLRQSLWTVSLANGMELAVRATEAPELALFPVKLRYTMPYTFYDMVHTATVVAAFDNIRLERPDQRAFLPPPGFRQFPDREMLLSMPYTPSSNSADQVDTGGTAPSADAPRLDDYVFYLGIAVPALICAVIAAAWIKWWAGKDGQEPGVDK